MTKGIEDKLIDEANKYLSTLSEEEIESFHKKYETFISFAQGKYTANNPLIIDGRRIYRKTFNKSLNMKDFEYIMHMYNKDKVTEGITFNFV